MTGLDAPLWLPPDPATRFSPAWCWYHGHPPVPADCWACFQAAVAAMRRSGHRRSAS